MKKILFLLFCLLGIGFSFAYSTKHFELNSETYFTGYSKLFVQTKGFTYHIDKLEFYVGGIRFLKFRSDPNAGKYIFVVPNMVALNPANLAMKFKVYRDNYTIVKDYPLPMTFPYLKNINFSGDKLIIDGNIPTTGCKLQILSGKALNISGNQTIYTGNNNLLNVYLDCDGLKSNLITTSRQVRQSKLDNNSNGEKQQNKKKSTLNQQTSKKIESQNIKQKSKLQNKKVPTKQEKIAQKLSLEKMKKLNNLLANYILKQVQIYKNNKIKLGYLKEMYADYLKMIMFTSNDFEMKVKYVDVLIDFAKVYFKFIK